MNGCPACTGKWVPDKTALDGRKWKWGGDRHVGPHRVVAEGVTALSEVELALLGMSRSVADGTLTADGDRTCDVCGASLAGRRSNTRTCGPKCRKVLQRRK
jgi:hypothetical protein